MTSHGDSGPLAGGRIATLDLIRGIAVLGILAANIVGFGQPFLAGTWPGAFLSGHDRLADWLWVGQFVLIDGKMRALFSLLFGAGMALFMDRAWARGATRWLQARRLLALLVIGLVHYLFIWRGDILTYYALFGLLVLPLLRLDPRTLLTMGATGYLAGAIVCAAMFVPLHLVAETPLGERPAFTGMRAELAANLAAQQADDRVESALLTRGDYPALVRHSLAEHGTEPLDNLLLFGLETVPLFLLGIGLFRLGLFAGQLDRARLARWGWIALGAGGLASLAIALWAKGTGFAFYAALAAFIGLSPLPRLAMALGLLALLVAYGPRATGWLGERLRAAGRTAFTNYLGTSVVMAVVFHGWGLGLYGELTREQLYGVMLAAWAVMLWWPLPWLERFRFGPLEWLWRCLTYGRAFALRR